MDYTPFDADIPLKSSTEPVNLSSERTEQASLSSRLRVFSSNGMRAALPLCASLIWLALAAYFNVFLLLTAHENVRAATGGVVQKLPDFSYQVLPDVSETFPGLPDLMVFLVAMVTAVRFALPAMRWTILRRWALAAGGALLVQGMWLAITPLPDPALPACFPAEEDHREPGGEALVILVGGASLCSAIGYWNHGVHLTLFGLVWHRYSHLPAVSLTSIDQLGLLWHGCDNPDQSDEAGNPRRMTTAKALVWAAVCTGYLSVLAAHFHYTSQVVTSAVLTAVVWRAYHRAVWAAAKCQPQNRGCFKRLLSWLEASADDRPAVLPLQRQDLFQKALAQGLLDEQERATMSPQQLAQMRFEARQGAAATNDSGSDGDHDLL